MDKAASAGRPSPLTRPAAVRAAFRSLNFQNTGIGLLDAPLASLPNLEFLNVSGNNLAELGNLPPSLLGLHAYCNYIAALEPSAAAGRCVHAGLGFNYIGDAPLRGLPSLLPALRVLDLTSNSVCDLGGAVAAAASLPALSHLLLAANPAALTRGYRSYVLRSLPRLVSLDDLGTEGGGGGGGADGGAPPSEIVLSVAARSIAGFATPEDVLALTEAAAAPVVAAAAGGKAGAKKPAAGAGGAAAKGGKGAKGKDAEPEAPPPPASTFSVSFELPAGRRWESAGAPFGRDVAIPSPVAVALPPSVAARDFLQCAARALPQHIQTRTGIIHTHGRARTHTHAHARARAYTQTHTHTHVGTRWSRVALRLRAQSHVFF